MAELNESTDVRELVRERYAAAALADDTVDVVISNCVINLSADKPRVLREAARVLRPGGRFAVSDVIADPHMDDGTKADCSSGPAASRAP